MPDQRTLIVLGSLVAGMTLTSALLLVLEPGPVAPLSDLSLQSVEGDIQPTAKLFDTTEPVVDGRWQGIIIHDSGTLEGDARTLNELHEQRGLKGLAYHFVITNGRGSEATQIEVGIRWKRQLVGAYYQGGPDAQYFNNKYIGICLIGDADRQPMTEGQIRELVWLVQQLQRRFDIPREEVFVQVGSRPDGKSPLFPHVLFREQLLNVNLP